MTGNYTLQTHFPAQITTSTKVAGGTPVNTTMLASDSEKLTLVVNNDPLRFNPGVPLPTEYWTRPINAQFREWYTVSASSWMDAENNEAPDAPHILWTKPLTVGGLAGGDLGLVGSGAKSVGFNIGDAYQGLYTSRFIIAGILVYSYHTGARPLEYTAVDLRTGEELWTRTFLDNQTIAMAQLFYWQSYNSQGSWPYLWVTVGTTWYAFNPFDAKHRFTIYNVPSGTNIIGEKGEIYRYTVNQTGGYMQLWNMSALISMQGGWGPNNYPGPNLATTYNASATNSTGHLTTAAARAWINFTIPTTLKGSVRAVKLGNKVVGSYAITVGEQYRSDLVGVAQLGWWAFSLEPGKQGQLLFDKTWKAPDAWTAGNQSLSYGATSIDENVATIWSKEERRHYGFSLETGDYLWVTEPEHYLNIFSAGRNIAYGMLYSVGQSGTIYAYDLTTGKIVWKYEPNDVYREVLWSNNWPVNIDFISGGKLYITHSEHSPNQPLPRLSIAAALNATTGEVMWRVDGLLRNTDWGGDPIMGDSVIAMYNVYDQRLYAVGKGPSATTVTAPDLGVQLGKSVLVRGMVTDVSPGTKQTAVTLRFPNGVPAVADDSVGEWMKYVYQQFPAPANATGVEVVVSVLDSNNNYYEVGRATSDASGFFSVAFTPEVPGKYTVYASFAGSDAYYGSYAETAINVEEAPAATPPPTPTPESVADMYFVPATTGIIIAIIAVGAVLIVLMLRKR
jgi:hypothetical protein